MRQRFRFSNSLWHDHVAQHYQKYTTCSEAVTVAGDVVVEMKMSL